MFDLVYSEPAENDLADIWTAIALHNQPAADRVLDRIRDACDQLRLFPQSAPAQPGIAADARLLVIERWLILHRQVEDIVEIVRVVDGRRDRSSWQGDLG